ncbi:ATP-binding protein [Neobacillus drentensis]|jgi:hypothetical protein|uniref:ATP-binding protein n=1 Tax=Neobacillus drentensis TaxID=220684 RepID=UPI002FFDB176
MLDQLLYLKRYQTPLREEGLGNYHFNEKDYQFIQINKLTLSDELEKEDLQRYVNRSIEQFVLSLSHAFSPVIFRMKSNRLDNSVSFSIGVKKKQGESIAERLSSYFQGVHYHEVNMEHFFESFQSQAFITGIPKENETKFFSYLEPFVRLARGKDLILEVVASPIHRTQIVKNLERLSDLRTANSVHLKKSHSESTAYSETNTYNEGETFTDGENSGGGLVFVNKGNNRSEGRTSSSSDANGKTETNTKNIEETEHKAAELDRFLETYLDRMQKALSTGLWKTSISIYTKSKEELSQACEVYQSTYKEESLEPYQTFKLRRAYSMIGVHEAAIRTSQHIDLFHEQFREYSFLTSKELSYVFDFPKEEYKGYEFSQSPRFGQSAPGQSGIPLGHIYDGDKITPTLYELDSNQLVKHMLVAGITGSGKTNTIFNLIQSIDVPFLIIEPAKKEYRRLNKIVPDLRVYTLGNEQISPLRINPFYFPQNVSIQQHIDNLKVIFNASFTMYASMPNILEQCFINVYIKKGWSLTTSKNIYMGDHDNLLYEKYFPTIEDLYYEIDSYTKELGYAQEQMQNIRAALLTRIKSLMTGGKGFLLNSVETMDIGELLSHPTVLELEAIADDDEKSLVIGLISMSIYEYLKANETDFTGELKHLLIMEEAHRIFTNVTQSGSQEDVNIKGKAVESLSHILSEIRAYGEGMIIIDQVPTKLAPDVLKNTNTKIIHRIVSRDDCEYVANSLGLTDDKVNFISKLTNGAALYFSDGMSSPAHLQVLYGKEHTHSVSDQELRLSSQAYNGSIYTTKYIHPLTEVIMQNLSNGYPQMEKILNDFYQVLLKQPLKNVRDIYRTTQENLTYFALEAGFDMSIDTDEFTYSFVKEGLNRLVKQDEKIRKQINKRILMERYLECCLELITKDYETHKKEYTLLERNQRRLGAGHFD